MTSFIPELEKSISTVPFFEENAKLKIPGRGTHKTAAKLQAEIAKLLGELGAFAVTFYAGKFDTKPVRYGYQISFRYANADGRIDVLALPMRHETPAKKQDALEQALYLLRNKTEAQVYARFYEAAGSALIPYLIGAGGLTVVEAVNNGGNLPMLANRNGKET